MCQHNRPRTAFSYFVLRPYLKRTENTLKIRYKFNCFSISGAKLSLISLHYFFFFNCELNSINAIWDLKSSQVPLTGRSKLMILQLSF